MNQIQKLVACFSQVAAKEAVSNVIRQNLLKAGDVEQKKAFSEQGYGETMKFFLLWTSTHQKPAQVFKLGKYGGSSSF